MPETICGSPLRMTFSSDIIFLHNQELIWPISRWFLAQIRIYRLWIVLLTTIFISKVLACTCRCLPLWVLIVAIMIVPSFPARFSCTTSILVSVLFYFAWYYSVVKWLSLSVFMLIEEFFIGLKILKNFNRSLGAFLIFGLDFFVNLLDVYFLDGVFQIVWCRV